MELTNPHWPYHGMWNTAKGENRVAPAAPGVREGPTTGLKEEQGT